MKTRKVNKGYIPFWNIIMFTESIFRKPGNIIEKKQQVEDVLENAMHSLFLIGGVTSTSTTSANAYYGLIAVAPNWVAIPLTIIISVVLLLTVDLSLGVIVPNAADDICDQKVTGRSLAAAWILMLVGISFASTSFAMSYEGMKNVVSYSMGDRSDDVTSVADVRSDEDGITEKMIRSLDKDIKAAEKEDKRKLDALEKEWDLKVKTAKRKYKKYLDKGNSWAIGQVEKVELRAAAAIKNFVPSATVLIEKKNKILQKREDNSAEVVDHVAGENEALDEDHQTKKGITSFLLRFIGCGSTVLAILIAFALALQKSSSPTRNHSYTKKQKKKTLNAGNQEVTRRGEKVTEYEFEVTEEVTEEIPLPNLIKRIRQNANHYKKRPNPMTYYDNILSDMKILARKVDRDFVEGFIIDLYQEYGIAGLDYDKLVK